MLVAHGASVLGAATGLLGGYTEINTKLCCLVKIVRTDEIWVMELNGDTSHLSQTQTTIRLN